MPNIVDPDYDLQELRGDLADYKRSADLLANPDAHYRARLAEDMRNLAQLPAGQAALRSLVTLVYNPETEMSHRDTLRLAKAGIVDITSKPEKMIYSPEDIKEALRMDDTHVWLGDVQLGSKKLLKVGSDSQPSVGAWTAANNDTSPDTGASKVR